MAATQAETQRDANVEQSPVEPNDRQLQNGTDKAIGRAPPDGVVNTKTKSPMSGEPGDTAPGHDRERPPPDQYGQYRYPEGDPYYGARPGFPGKPRPPPPQQQARFFPGQPVSQAPGPTPTLNSLLQSSGAPPHRYPNNYEQPPGAYPPGPGWPPPRPMPPYSPQGSPYRNSTPPRGYGGPPYGAGAPSGPQQPPGAYGPPGSYPQRYPPPPGAPNSRPPFSPHQGYERAGSPQPPGQPPGAPSPGAPGSAGGGMSPTHDAHMQQHHQGYPPPPRPPQPSTPNAHDPDSDLTGQNSNDSAGSGGAGRATTPHLRPTPSPTGSSGSRSMSPAVGTQNAPMPPRTSSSIEGGGVRGAAPPPAPGQGYHHPGYKPSHYAPQPPYGYPPRNHHPYPYGGYRPPPPHPPHQTHQSHQPHQPHPQHPPQHYPPPNKQQARHMGPPGPGGPGGPGGEGAMPPPTAPGDPHDNGAPPATALVTTGPDGALDEGSQQSTLSNASAASNEESCGTPKPRKEFVGAGGSPAGPAHAHDEYDAPAAWPRPPSSPVFNHIPPESYRTKKSDSLGKLYEMDDSPERRGWVERLLAFMEERRTPIAACPTISKQPLDLYRLYLLVRDRGGFVEVTKNKTWKDIAGLLGIGASSSAAYTLRKHYTKNLLAYECHFDRGGIDPQPIINQVEASTKKKSGKANNTANAGSSNSQESFPAGSPAPGAPMDGYGNQYAGYPPQQNQQQGGGPGGDNLAASNPFDEPPGPRRPQGYQQGYGYEYGSPYPPNRPVYPPYGPEGDRGYGSGGEYRYGYGYRAGAPPPPAAPPPAQPYPDYCRAPPAEMGGGSSSVMGSQLARQLIAPLSPNRPYYPGGKTGGPGASPGAAAGAPRRHPDFAKAEAGYSGAAAGAGAAGAGPRFPPAWGAAFPRPPAPPAQPAAWRAPPAPQPWPPQPYQQNATGAPSASSGAGLKRELTFPAECVEGAAPAADKRRRLTRADVAPLDAWRLVMALKCGLPAETTWALDALNVLLFDDQALPYFPLPGLPGLLDLLLELFHRALADVFDAPPEPNTPWYQPVQSEAECNDAPPPAAPSPPPAPDPAARVRLLRGEDFTLQSRRRAPVVLREAVPPAPSPPPDAPDAERVRQVLEPWQAAGAAPPAPHALPPPAADPRALPILRVLPGASRPTVSTTPPPAPPSAMADNLTSEPMELEPEARGSLQIRDPAGILRRRRLREYEDECYARDEPALNLLTDAQAARARRALAVSNALRSLTFVPGNEPDFARSPAYLALAGKLLLLHHEHAPRGGTRPQKDLSSAWWWEALGLLREDALVGVANVAGALELRALDEAAARPLLDGLLHWCVCGAAVAGDAGAATALSPRRLALEALCKLCVPDGNVDLLVATPPRERLPELCAALARELCRPERPVLREFAVTLLHQVAGAGGAAAHALASHAPVLQQLLGFIERAEAAALGVANQHGVAALREHPDAMGTSLDMLRRAAATLARLARHAHCRSALRRHERRLLSLVMSQILDQKVAHELADVLYHCQAPDVNSDP